jgi:hypothetical protein
VGVPASGMNGVYAPPVVPAGDQANAVVFGQILAIGPQAPFAFRGPMNLVLYASLTSPLVTTNGSTAASVTTGTGIAAGDAINSVNVPAGTTWAAFSGTSGTLALPPVSFPGIVNLQQAQISGIPNTNGLNGAGVTGPGLPSGVVVTGIVVASVMDANGNCITPGVLSLSALPTSAPVYVLPQEFYTFTPTGNIVSTGTDAKVVITGAAITFDATVQLERSFDGGKTWVICNLGAPAQTPVIAQWTGATVAPVSITFGEPEKNVYYRLNCTAYTSGTINYRISQTGGAAESLAIGPLSGG